MFYIGVLCRRITPKKSSDKPPEVWKHASMLIRRIKVRVIYIDGSPLCRLGMKTLLGGGVITLSSPNMNIIKNISPAPDLIIMEFPQEIYRFEAYLEFIKYSRGEYKGVRLLFFIDKTSPLIPRLSLRRSRMRFCTNGKRCRWCERPAQRWPARDERTTRGEPAAGGGNHAWRGGGAV